MKSKQKPITKSWYERHGQIVRKALADIHAADYHPDTGEDFLGDISLPSEVSHLPWIGERTRGLDGAHVEFFRGVVNPVAVKIGPNASPAEVVDTCHAINPKNERGKLVLVARLGAKLVAERLPPIIEAVKRAGCRVLWVCDPMHGNIITTQGNVKTRDFEDILAEIETSMDVHDQLGTYLGGVHFELTGDDVTECIGGVGRNGVCCEVGDEESDQQAVGEP